MQFEPQTLDELLDATPEQIEATDIARVNLLCATELRGAEDLDIDRCIRTIDQWTEEVRQFTAFNFTRYSPKSERDTPDYLRCWSMVKLIRHHKGLEHMLCPRDVDGKERLVVVSPNERGSKNTYYNSDNVFIHGLLGPKKMGVCTTFPVVYAAVGRRLGYPMKLMLTVCHVFSRWDDPKDGFNIDASSTYINRHPTDHFMDTPRPWSDYEKGCPGMLRPLTRVEEFGEFLGWRALSLECNGRYDEAEEVCERAMKLFREHNMYWLYRRIKQAQIRVFMEQDGWGYEPDVEEAEDEPAEVVA